MTLSNTPCPCATRSSHGYCQGCLYLSLYDSYLGAQTVGMSTSSPTLPAQDQAVPVPGSVMIEESGSPPDDHSSNGSTEGTEESMQESWHTAPASLSSDDGICSPWEDKLSTSAQDDISARSQNHELIHIPELPVKAEPSSAESPENIGGTHTGQTVLPLRERLSTPSPVQVQAPDPTGDEVSSLSSDEEIQTAAAKGKRRERDMFKAPKRQSVNDWYYMTPLTHPGQPSIVEANTQTPYLKPLPPIPMPSPPAPVHQRPRIRQHSPHRPPSPYPAPVPPPYPTATDSSSDSGHDRDTHPSCLVLWVVWTEAQGADALAMGEIWKVVWEVVWERGVEKDTQGSREVCEEVLGEG
ncbi:hypothetical protein F5Y18DRAFT_436603 [Xylariaceae sp. FL1019]|nr:hypothetical protein F5Y18DRAFT_436603 [Xylariaceae sp. FL1019]